MNFEGQNINLQDALFVDNITGDIENFRVRSSSIARVLVFPPVNNYHRFLIHKVVETGFPQFTTFSVGEGLDRRTVVCFQQHLLEHTLKLVQAPFVREETGSVDLLEHKEESDENKDQETTNNNEVNNEVKSEETASRELNSGEINTDITEVPYNEHTDKNHECSRESVIECIDLDDDEKGSLAEDTAADVTVTDMKIKEDDSKQDEDNDEESPDPDQVTTLSDTKSSPEKNGDDDLKKRRSKRPAIAVYVPPRGRNSIGSSAPTQPVPATQISSAETSPADIGPAQPSPAPSLPEPETVVVTSETLDVTEQVVSEITVAVGGVQIEGPEVDYLSFQTSDSTINIDQFGHVIELYDFPVDFKTTDLVNAFQAFTSRWDIKWVDDTHALGVFSSSEVAAEALSVRHPSILTRPLNMATPQSKSKARSVLEELLPYKPRPVSCTAPARRLLQWALGSGMRVPEASRQENERLQDARRRKEEVRKKDGDKTEDRKRREEGAKPNVDKKHRYDEHDHR